MKVVVVGAGMVGHRVAEELHALDPDVEIDLVGEEEYEPYNRVLLTELLAGRVDLAGLTMPRLDAGRLRLHLGRGVTEVDRERQVVLADGVELPYDHLVIATGARARVIPVPGLRDGLPGGAHVLRSLDDARDVKAATLNARHAVVIGGGPLGLEAACGLRHRGVGVTLLTVAPSVLDRDLDPHVADVVAESAADLGVELVPQAQVESVAVRDGQVAAVHLGGGRVIDTQLVLLACGAVPETSLAARAGLETNQGVVVGHDLRTTLDRRVSAIGDCAETPEGTSGLVAPGWAQARQAARNILLDELVEPTGITGSAMRLKAVGLSVVTMGRRESSADSHDRVISLADRRGRRFVELVVRDDTLVGMTCVGAPEVAANLSTQVDRPGLLPADPLQLVVGTGHERGEPVSSPTTMPTSTTVCRCNGVTKGDLVAAWQEGATDTGALATTTRATTGCGGCSALVCGIVDWLAESDQQPSVPPTSQSPLPARERTVPVR